MLSEGELLRFWPKVDVCEVDECWPWTAGQNGNGYGFFRRQRGGMCLAHRLAWEQMHGEIPEGLCVLHSCDNKVCVNPRHLWLGTKADNNADRDRKGRQRSPLGERHGQAKLTRQHVREIRARAAAGETWPALAQHFGVSRSAVQGIVHRKNWAWLAPASCS